MAMRILTSFARAFRFGYQPLEKAILTKSIQQPHISNGGNKKCIAGYCTFKKRRLPIESSGTMAEVHEKMINRLGLDRGYEPVPKSRENLLQYTPKLDELPARCMQDSYTMAVIPLSKNKDLQDKYVTLTGYVRFGRLLEDMDLFAVWVVHQHVHLPKLPEGIVLPYTFVTVLVDKIDFNPTLRKIDKDIYISGHVSWVGRTTLEVVVWLEQIDGGISHEITRAVFLMAARNATNTAALHVNPLEPANDDERKILSGGEERKKRRKVIQETSIFKIEPNNFEETLMYNLYQRTTDTRSMELNKRILPSNCRWMSESFNVNTVAAFPEHRNAHNSIFGGFIMRSALEISFVASSLYCKERALIRHFCDITFEKPVSVKSFLKMFAYIVYTEANYMTIMTVIDTVDVITGSDQMTTNIFYSVFEAKEYVPEVLPRSYQETMWYIQGRRKFRYALGLE